MPQHITLSELQSLIKRGIDDAHPLPYWVTAEISELKVNYSGHCYLEQVEKGGANHVPKAKISVVIWRSLCQLRPKIARRVATAITSSSKPAAISGTTSL